MLEYPDNETFPPGSDPAAAAYRAAFSPAYDHAHHLREALGITSGLCDLIADDADTREFHREALVNRHTESAARAAYLLLKIAAVQAEAVARERDHHRRQTAPAPLDAPAISAPSTAPGKQEATS